MIVSRTVVFRDFTQWFYETLICTNQQHWKDSVWIKASWYLKPLLVNAAYTHRSKGLATSFACGHPAHLLKTILSPWNSFGNLVKSQLTMDVWDISRILILFHSPITCLHVSTVLTWLLSILGSFETGKCESFSFVLTLHAVLTPNCEQLYVNKP